MEQSEILADMRSPFDEVEIEVAEILLNLWKIISMSVSRNHFWSTRGAKETVNWVVKRKRSSRDSGPTATYTETSSPSPSTCQAVQKASRNERETKTSHQVKVEATSPATPLSFSPSESDEKSKHFHQRVPKKKTREQLLDAIKSLTDHREMLQKELENVKNYYNMLLAFNSQLKALKHKVESSDIVHNRDERQLATRSKNIGLRMSHSYQISGRPYRQPCIGSIADPRAGDAPTREQFHYQYGPVAQPFLFSSNNNGGEVNLVGPIGIPDLNVTLEDNCGVDSVQPLDYDKGARFAEARRKRMTKMKEKRRVRGVMKPPRFN